MEENIDIYADLPNFSLNVDKDEEGTVCKCEELRKELSKLKSKYENIQNINKTLEKNMASLLKTAKIEIARKDRTIGDLRKEMDDIAFRRKNNNPRQSSLSVCTCGSSYQQCTVVEKHENIVSSTYPDENKVISYQNEINDKGHESKKLQNDTDRIPVTVFGERLHKKIIDEEKEEKRQKVLSKLNAETDIRKIPEEGVAESDKENGSQLSINNITESNAVTQNSNLETSCKRNTGKRTNDEDDTCRNKRLKTEDNDDKTTSDDIDYNYIMQYDVKSNPAKLEERLDAIHSNKKEQVPLSTKHKDTSEDTMKQDRSTNKWKREVRSSSGRDCNISGTRGGSADDLRNCWAASKSNERFNSERQYDFYNNDYKKKSYRSVSPTSRGYSKSRSDYENNHRLRDVSGRTYKDRRYEDYKYNNRHRNDKFGRDYSNNENDNNRTRYNNRERSDLRDRLKHSSNDVNREMRNNYNKNNKYDSRRIKVPVDSNTKETKGAPLLLQTNLKNIDQEVQLKSSSKNNTVANEVYNHNNDYDICKVKVTNETHIMNDKKLHENNKAAAEIDSMALSNRLVVYTKNESCNDKLINSTESTSMNTVATDNLEEAEEGEILDSPTVSPEKKSNSINIFNNKATKVKIVPVEDKNRNTAANAIRDNGLVIPPTDTISMKQLVNEMCDHNNHNGTCKSCSDENLMDSVARNIQMTIERARDNTEDENCTNSVKENFKNLPIENVAMVEEVNNFNIDDNICKTDDEVSTNFIATKIEVVSNCVANKDSADRSQMSIENETLSQIYKNNAEMNHSCLNDHNYVRYVTIDPTELDIVQKPSVKSECKIVLEKVETATSKETRTKETVTVQSASIKKMTSSTSKNKKEQPSKQIVVLRRRKAVTLSDNKASMTVLMNKDTIKVSSVVKKSINDNNDSVSKPRACKQARVCKSGL